MNIRDNLLRLLHFQGVSVENLTNILVTIFSVHSIIEKIVFVSDVVIDPDAKYMESRLVLRLSGGKDVSLNEDTRNAIEDYMNASHVTGRPFVDYRPDIGLHLFPSPRTGGGIHRRTVRGILERLSSPSEVGTKLDTSPQRSEESGRDEYK